MLNHRKRKCCEDEEEELVTVASERTVTVMSEKARHYTELRFITQNKDLGSALEKVRSECLEGRGCDLCKEMKNADDMIQYFPTSKKTLANRVWSILWYSITENSQQEEKITTKTIISSLTIRSGYEELKEAVDFYIRDVLRLKFNTFSFMVRNEIRDPRMTDIMIRLMRASASVNIVASSDGLRTFTDDMKSYGSWSGVRPIRTLILRNFFQTPHVKESLTYLVRHATQIECDVHCSVLSLLTNTKENLSLCVVSKRFKDNDKTWKRSFLDSDSLVTLDWRPSVHPSSWLNLTQVVRLTIHSYCFEDTCTEWRTEQFPSLRYLRVVGEYKKTIKSNNESDYSGVKFISGMLSQLENCDIPCITDVGCTEITRSHSADSPLRVISIHAIYHRTESECSCLQAITHIGSLHPLLSLTMTGNLYDMDINTFIAVYRQRHFDTLPLFSTSMNHLMMNALTPKFAPQTTKAASEKTVKSVNAWKRIAGLIAFVRANLHHPFVNSGLALFHYIQHTLI